MKNTYIGKPYKNGYEICRVIDSDIATGAALVYNRNTRAVEVIPYSIKIRLDAREQEWLNDNEAEYEADFHRACKKYSTLISAFAA